MKGPDQIGMDVEIGFGADPWRGGTGLPVREVDLERLYALLDRPWFCRRHNVLFDLAERGQERVIHITKGGMLVATWTMQGHTLVFQPAADGHEERAGTLDCAISITCDFLDHVRIKPAASAAARRAAAH